MLKHTLTVLSHEAEMTNELLPDGEILTAETQSLWPVKVAIHSPMVFQTLTVLSLEAETICLEFLAIETDKTSPLWPTNLVVLPDSKSHNLKVLSQEADKA